MLFRSNDTATTEIYTQRDTLSLHDALPIWMEFWAAVMATRPIEEFAIPGNVVFVPVDAMGHPGAPGAPGVHMESFVAGTEPHVQELAPEPAPAASHGVEPKLSGPDDSRDSEPGPGRT